MMLRGWVAEAEERLEVCVASNPGKLKKAVDDALELVELLERHKHEVPPQIKLILKAMREGAEIGLSAEEASQHFAKFLKDMDKECKIQEERTGEDAFVCLAKRERTEGSLGRLYTNVT